MSNEKAISQFGFIYKGVPVFVKKKSLQKVKVITNPNKLVTTLTSVTDSNIREDVVYESESEKECFIRGYRKMLIVNQFHKINSSCRTLGTYTTMDNQIINKTSDGIVHKIGQKNYDLLFSALCSVINQELKVKAINSLLTEQILHKDAVAQTDYMNKGLRSCRITKEAYIQTDILTPQSMFKIPVSRRLKRTAIVPYVVKNEFDTTENDKDIDIDKAFYVKEEKMKISINPDDLKDTSANNKLNKETTSRESKKNIDKKSDDKGLDNESTINTFFIDESSNLSVGSNFSFQSDNTVIIEDAAKFLMNLTEQHVKLPPEKMVLNDDNKVNHEKTVVQNNTNDSPTVLKPTCVKRPLHVPLKLEDVFHIATPDILASLPTAEDKHKRLYHQAYLDWKYCLLPNEDDKL